MADMGDFRQAVTAWAAGGAGDDTARELATRLPVHTVVLLEGPSDVAAVNALAASRGRDLAAEGVCVLAMGGAMSVGRFARLLGPAGLDLRLTGLCDEAERPFYARGLALPDTDAGTNPDADAGTNPDAGTDADPGTVREPFFVCAADLEDELIRALGPSRVTELVREQGDLRALRTFVHQPAQRGRTSQQQLRRFFGTKKGRKVHYGRVLVEALDPDRVPAPLDELLTNL